MRVIVPALLASAMLLASVPAALSAQEVVQPLPGTTDADRLAEQMRALAANPRDLEALITAADLSLSLDDLSGAASLYARAEKVSARDPRIKAGEGAILVRSERPGEALRYFQQAEAAGYDVRRYAADRGLAYDLIGQQERAQRDYRLALKDRADDEIVKRYALSLGISGQREAALQLLDPLVRKQDRSAWRVRAFVLAMNGDQPGAEKIVTTMLPQGMAQGLLPFFQRLPALPAADRAFAVHFGEVRASPERIADARLAPVLPQLAPERPPVALAAVQPAQQRPTRDSRRRGRGRDRDVAPAVALAANNAAPAYQTATAALARVQPVPQERAPVALASATVQPLPVRTATPVATVQPLPTRPVETAAVQSAPARTPVAATSAPASAAVSTATPTPLPTTSAPVALASTSPAPTPSSTAPTTSAPVALASVSPAPSMAAPATNTPAPGFATEVVQPLPAARPVETAAAAPAPNFTAPPSRAEADSVLARIVAGLSIPAAELGVVEPAKPAPPPAAKAETGARVLAEAKAKEERDAAAEQALALQAAADKRAADRKAAADKKAAAAKKLADDKAAAAKKAATEKKLAEAKEAAEEKKLARANPERIWVQVAGGAYVGDLPKAYAGVKAKAPAAFGSRGAWTTPLRATNRVLIGPFKTDAEARAQVNTLAKAGVSAFTFTSDAGQVVTKLPAK